MGISKKLSVNEDKLDYLLEQLVSGFNDCVCCPLTFICREQEENCSIDTEECSEKLKVWLNE